MKLKKAPAALLLLVVAGDHLNLYLREHYNSIPKVGDLFLLTVIAAIVFATLVLIRPSALVLAAAAGFAASVLLAYMLTLYLPHGLFLFKEPKISYSGAISILAELGVFVLLAPAAARALRAHRTKLL